MLGLRFLAEKYAVLRYFAFSLTPTPLKEDSGRSQKMQTLAIGHHPVRQRLGLVFAECDQTPKIPTIPNPER